MIFQKILIAAFAIATMVLIYINKKDISALFIVQKPALNKTIQIVNNDYVIDKNIINKNDYFVDERLKNMYSQLIISMIKRDKDIRQRLLFMKDLDSKAIQLEMVKLDLVYDKEMQKAQNYCIKGSTNCKINVSLTGKSVVGSDVEININYILDEESLAFFNQVHYVQKEQDKWYEAMLLSMNEKRYYPKIGKFQDRKMTSMLQDNQAQRVDVTHVLEGNTNEWNVKF